MKKIVRFLVVFICTISVFIFLLFLACSFPSSWIKSNVIKSSKTLSNEGNRKICFIFEKFQFQEFDNYSDSLMINTAYSIDNKTPIYSAFTAKKNYIPGVTQKIEEDVIGELKSSSKYEKHDEVGELADTIKGIGEESFEYAKYWHGYLSILRPLLLVLDYQQIRILLALILAILAIITTTLIAEKKNNIIAGFYLFALFNVDYFYLGLSIMNSLTFIIAMCFSIALIKRFNKIKEFGLFFFIIGMFTGFFCLLDTPLITLGMPLIFYFIMKDGDGSKNFIELIKFSLYWIMGYFATWMVKWILMDLLYNRKLILTALGQVLYRSVGGQFLPVVAICINLINMVIPILITTLFMVYIFIKYNKNLTKRTRKKGRIFLMISILPILWYSVLSNHSVYHSFFTYRLQFISMFSMMIWIYSICLEIHKNKET